MRSPFFHQVGQFDTSGHRFFSSQVLASWLWSNCLHAQAPPSQEVLRINMGETSIRLYQDAGKGLLVARACRQRRTPRGLV